MKKHTKQAISLCMAAAIASSCVSPALAESMNAASSAASAVSDAVYNTVNNAINTQSASITDGSTQDTQVSYSVSETDWIWTVPSTQTLTNNALITTEKVSIMPVRDHIMLPPETVIKIYIDQSAGSFNLRSIDNKKSKIPYCVAKTDTLEAVALKDVLLEYDSGISDNTGISQDLFFGTTEENIKKATVTGTHVDTLTFALSVTVDGVPKEYKIIEGANQVYKSEGEAYLRSTGAYEEFKDVVIDGEVLDESNYRSAEGSTKVWLSEEYLKTLDVGTHDISIESEGGTASTQITIWRSGEVTYNNQDIYYFPTSTSSAEKIASGNPELGDRVIYGDYTYEYIDGVKVSTEMQKLVDESDDGWTLLVAAIIISAYGSMAGVEDNAINSGWVCLRAGIDPISVEANNADSISSQDELWKGAKINTTKSSYGTIASYICGKPVVGLYGTFDCRNDENNNPTNYYSNLRYSPTIPNTVKAMSFTYGGSALSQFPKIPDSVTYMNCTFGGSSGICMDKVSTNVQCKNLYGTITINGELSTAINVFGGISGSVRIAGTASNETKQKLIDSNKNNTYGGKVYLA